MDVTLSTDSFQGMKYTDIHVYLYVTRDTTSMRNNMVPGPCPAGQSNRAGS